MYYNVCFDGFEPEAEFQSLVNDMMWKLSKKSPAFSANKAILTKNKHTYSAEININSQSDNFNVVSENADPKELLIAISKLINTKLIRWKKYRQL